MSSYNEVSQYQYNGIWLSKREIFARAKQVKQIGIHIYYGKCYSFNDYAVINDKILMIRSDVGGEFVYYKGEKVYI
jgi:hypothetical protein